MIVSLYSLLAGIGSQCRSAQIEDAGVDWQAPITRRARLFWHHPPRATEWLEISQCQESVACRGQPKDGGCAAPAMWWPCPLLGDWNKIIRIAAFTLPSSILGISVVARDWSLYTGLARSMLMVNCSWSASGGLIVADLFISVEARMWRRPARRVHETWRDRKPVPVMKASRLDHPGWM